MSFAFSDLLTSVSFYSTGKTAACVVLLSTLGAPLAPQGGFGASETMIAGDAARTTAVRRLAEITLGENARLVSKGDTARESNAAISFVTGGTEPMSAFRAIDETSENYSSARNCLAQAVYYEAANEPVQGQRAVAQVVLNRVRHPAYPSSVCGVVYEGWSQPVCQFSFVCDGSLRRTPMARQWRQALTVAGDALAGHVETSVGTATHYHADYVLPRWAFTLAKIRQIGAHLFYRFPGTGGRARTFSARWSGSERIPTIDWARFDAGVTGEEEFAADLIDGGNLPPDPTDRRAPNDVGGRMDPSKGWRLAIPDPVAANPGYQASLRDQREAARIAAIAGDVVP